MEVGGAETMLVDIANAQAARGHRVALLIVNDRESPQVMDALSPQVRVVRFHRREGSAPLLLLARLNVAILRLHPDVVHVHHQNFCRLVRVFRGRLLYTVHNLHIPMDYCREVRMAAITDAVAEDVRARVPGAMVDTVLNGISVDAIRWRGGESPDKVFRIVQVGRFDVEQKGQDLLVKALGELHRRGVDNVEVTFIGRGPDEAMLRQLAVDEGVAEYVHFAGVLSRSQIYDSLAGFDAMVHPSRYEGFGLVIAEGMAAGLPLIVTEKDGPWEVAGNGRFCTSVPREDVGALADAIDRLRTHYAEAAALAAEGRRYARRYDISNTVDAYQAIYNTMFTLE